MQHKWHKEIKAWADGAEIEESHKDHTNNNWIDFNGEWGDFNSGWEFRIKPQPKYLYIWKPYDEANDLIVSDRKPKKNDILDDGVYKLIGKVKLEEV